MHSALWLAVHSCAPCTLCTRCRVRSASREVRSYGGQKQQISDVTWIRQQQQQQTPDSQTAQAASGSCQSVTWIAPAETLGRGSPPTFLREGVTSLL